MRLKTKKVLGVDITVDPKEIILEKIEKYLKKTPNYKYQIPKKAVKPLVVFTPNPEIINFAQKKLDFRKSVNTAQIKIPDGAGIVWAIKKLHKMEIPKITGVDFMQELVFWAAENGVVTGLIGGREGVALKALKCLRMKYSRLQVEVLKSPNLIISNFQFPISKQIPNSPPPSRLRQAGKFQIQNSTGKILQTEEYFSTLANQIKKKKIGILFVALGFPKQEYFIQSLNSKFQSPNSNYTLVMMGVGGAFDYISGTVPRAPRWMQDGGLEWLYRLYKEPWRIGRQIEGGKFFWKILFNNP